MQFLSALPISRKLPTLIVALSLAASLSIAVIGYLDFSGSTRQQTEENFELVTQSRADSLVEWGARIESEVAILGRDPTVVAAVHGFDSSYELMIDSAGLQQAYITDNPNPPGARDRYDQAPESLPYHFQHGRFHPHFRQVTTSAGYYDLFVLNLAGDLIYSVKKESDYATNFLTGPYADSGLGEAFRMASEGTDGQVYFADFATYAAKADIPAAFLSTPVIDPETGIIGVVAIQVPTNQIAQIMTNPLGLGETGDLYVVGHDGQTRSPSRREGGFGVLTDVSSLPQTAASFQQDTQDVFVSVDLSGTEVYTMGRPLRVFDREWGMIGQIDLAEVNAPIAAIRNKMIGVSLLVAILSILIGGWVARSFVSPLGRLGSAMQQVAQKDYDVTLPDQDRRDEIGTLARNLLDFRDKLQASDATQAAREAEQETQKDIVERLSLGLGHLSRGDLTQKIETRFDGAYDQLRQDFNHTVDKLNDALGSLRSRADSIRGRADGLSSSADDLSRRTESQAATLEQTAAALDEMTASVRSAAAGAKEVAGVVTDARQDAEESRPVVDSAVEAMHAIANSSAEISKIIGVIDDIAFQTNLLALNAGVEAARAGEAGRGFAVVASEVRALAQRSSDAAKQIKELIGQSTHQVQDGVDLVGKAGEVLTKIATHIGHISGLIGDIASGAEEQSIGLTEINVGVTQLDKVTQQNAAMVEEATANSHALKGDARELGRLVETFHLERENAPNEIAGFNADADVEALVPTPMAAVQEGPGHAARKVAVAGGAAGQDIWAEF